MQSPFGAYRGGYNAMPAGYMDAWRSVGQNYANAISSVGNAVAGGIGQAQAGQQMKDMGMQSAPTNMSQYQQLAQATGQQVDPSILQRYQGLSEMSGPQVQQFNKDIQAAQQQAITLANIQRQQQQFQMQQHAAQRAMQMQQNSASLQARRLAAAQAVGLTGSMMPSAGNQQPIPAQIPANPFDNYGSLLPRVGTVQGLPMTR